MTNSADIIQEWLDLEDRQDPHVSINGKEYVIPEFAEWVMKELAASRESRILSAVPSEEEIEKAARKCENYRRELGSMHSAESTGRYLGFREGAKWAIGFIERGIAG